ncbi:hypothetical protein Droror1_Dr00022367 [Drosera rotundifolia]
MFPSNSTIQNPFSDHYSSSLDENPSNFLLNFPPHLLDDDELLLGHFLQHQHQQQQQQEEQQEQEQQHVPTNSTGDEAAIPSAPPEVAPEVKTTTEKPKRGAAKSNNNKRKEKEKAADQEATADPKGTPEATATGKKKRATTARQPGAPRRRTGKKDRHSKIYTAQGPRDRRMRLSLQIARKFFDLQDMLGFDKASKTIEWLFTKSKAAIKDLTSSLPQKKNLSCGSASSATSECIGLDVMEDAHVVGHLERSSSEIKDPEEDISKRKTRNTTRKTASQLKQLQQQHQNTQSTSHSHPTSLARESRDKARARARQRTKEKMLQKEIEKRKQMGEQNPTNPSNDTNNNNNNNNNMEKFGSSSTTPETTYCEESAQEFNSSIEISPPITVDIPEKCSSSANVHQQALEHKMASVGIIEKLLGASSRSSSSIYDYGHHHDQHHEPMGLESMGLRSPSDHGFLGFSGHSWMAAESARMINGVTNPAGYSALMMNGSNIMLSALQEQNPNAFFMTASGSIYLQQPHHHHQFLPNQFSCNNSSLDGNHDPSPL